MTRYVQHRSGDGKTWEVRHEYAAHWNVVRDRRDQLSAYDLPKSEYLEVPAPEVWTDVTSDCEVGVIYTGIAQGSKAITGPAVDGFRLRKVRVFDENGENILNRWAFIVERKVPS